MLANAPPTSLTISLWLNNRQRCRLVTENYNKKPALTRSSRLLGKSQPKRKANRVGRPKAGTYPIAAQEAITNAALPLFASTSFSAVSTKDIANAAGLNTALIYYYFGSKEELFRRAVLLAAQQATASFASLQAAGQSATQRIFAWLNCHETQFPTILQLLRISMSYASTPERSQAVDAVIQDFHSETRRMLTDAFEDGVRTNEINRIDVTQTVHFVATYLDGIYLRAIILPDFDPQPEIAELRAFLETRSKATEG